ncbi:MAG TPA: AraC family transcriptional regulator [Polyangiaceae bacterium]|nr:AraC family transcriptional regulator [Polyangiaceae bacterium]
MRLLPPRSLSEYVAHFWSVRWALDEPRLAETLPHPTFHMVFESSTEARGRGEVAGVPRGRFSRTLQGAGWVFGVKFRPAMFEPLLGASASTLTGRVVPIDSIFGEVGSGLSLAMCDAQKFEVRAKLVENFLVPRLRQFPAASTSTNRRVRDLVERMATDRSLLRVESAAELLETDPRTLQRHFRRYVGVSPKWVILRYRLHEAAERLKGPNPPSLAALAAELGYADQAHFARDFRKWVGQPPSEFASPRAPYVR